MRITLIAALVLSSALAYADEGQWQPYQMPSIADKLIERGIEIPATQLADLGQYPMNAVVSLGYCTASFVSPQGLVVTNHHCAYRGIQYNSKKEHNYLADGFLAKTMADEPSTGPNERLYITENVSDVTQLVTADLSDEPLMRYEQIQTNSKSLIKICEADDNYHCSVNSYHNGLEYFLIKQLIIRDVRLVYAPPESIGGYGGDIDNYEYPRHSGDFTFLRAYVGKNGKPATYSADNVPFQPKSYLKVNTDGVKAGDGVFAAGYPGSTSRYNLTSELKFASDWLYPTHAARYLLQIDTITQMGNIDKNIAIKYAGTMASMANRMKKLNGLLDGFKATDIVGIKQSREDGFLAWLKEDESANPLLIQELEVLLAEQQKYDQINYYFENAQSSALLLAAKSLYRLAQEKQKPDAMRESGYQKRDMKMFRAGLKRIDSSFDIEVDKTLWLQDLNAYIAQPLKVKVFDDALNNSSDHQGFVAKIHGIYASTELTDQATRLAWIDKTVEEFQTSTDPFIRLAVELHDTNMALEQESKVIEGKLSKARPEYMAAIIAYYKANNWPVYPDANRTLRITYGMVDGYQSKDALYKQPFTRLQGIAAKHTGAEPYNVPTKLLAAIATNDYGKHTVQSIYNDPRSWLCRLISCIEPKNDFNSVPVNFLSSVDTTGGNSGSPIFNGRGELVGLNFDSTYEAITKDWFFNPTITRAVHVDIRYILWMMDQIDHADNLIKELTLVRNPEFQPFIQLEEVQQDEAQLEEAKLDEAQLDEAQLDEAKLDEAQLDEAKLDEAKLDEAKLDEAQLDEAQLDEAQLDEAQLEEAKLDEAKLEESQLGKSQLDKAQLEEAQREEAQLEETQLEEAKLEEAKLDEAKLEEAKLEEAKLDETQLDETQLEEAKLEEAKLDEAQLNEAQLEEAKQAKVKQAEVEQAEVEQTEVKPAEVKQAEVEQTEVKPAEVEQTEVKPAEVEQTEVKPAEAEQTEVKPAEAEQTEVKPAEAEQTEVKPAEVEQTEVKPAEVKQAEVKQTEVKPAEVEQTEVKPAEVEQTEVKPAEAEQTEVKPAEVEQTEVKPAEVKQAEVKQAEVKQAEVKQAEVKPAEVKQAEVKQAEVKQAEVKQAEVKQAEVKQAEVKQAEEKQAEENKMKLD
jgi:uncharacterized protein YjbI with pentapeptide repeats